jgi:calcineurin-like phosphoesterase family protein
MSKKFFTGCPHYGGAGISEYASRPFKSPDEMNRRLILNNNMRVKPEDRVFCVGDFACYGKEKGKDGLRVNPTEYLDQLQGRYFIVEGNHDKNNRVKTDAKFLFMNIGPYRAFLTHYPTDSSVNKIINSEFWREIVRFAVFNTDFAVNSHVHDSWKYKVCNQFGRRYVNFNVGVDVNRYMPISEQEVIQQIGAIFKKENIHQ